MANDYRITADQILTYDKLGLTPDGPYLTVEALNVILKKANPKAKVKATKEDT
jgi:hypothetical protein